jgi:CheY-like chemotaxis protein
LAFEPTENLPSIMMDTSQIDRILTNLVTNSVDAMSVGGRIVLSTKLANAAELPEILPELASESYVCLTVADTGKGIDSSTREHVFEPFFTTKDRGRGTGLGLPVVYGLMQAHHGYVDVKSEMGKGTIISLFFPVPKQATVSPPSAHTTDPALRGTETILVVEDETDVSFFLETILQSHGYKVIRAADYDEALEAFKKHQDKIQLVFSDIGLPRVDGISLCEKLRVLKPRVPLILASGYPTKEFKSRINDLGPQAFLSKPYNSQDILQTIRKVLGGSQALHLSS